MLSREKDKEFKVKILEQKKTEENFRIDLAKI